MFLRAKICRKDGKEHRTFSIVENRRVSGGHVVQRHVLYLGEINDSQELAWRRSIEAFEDGAAQPRPLSLFPEDRCEGVAGDGSIGRKKRGMSDMSFSPTHFDQAPRWQCYSLNFGRLQIRFSLRTFG